MNFYLLIENIFVMAFLSIIGTMACMIGSVWDNKNGAKWFKTGILSAIIFVIFLIAGLLLIDYNTNYLGGM